MADPRTRNPDRSPVWSRRLVSLLVVLSLAVILIHHIAGDPPAGASRPDPAGTVATTAGMQTAVSPTPTQPRLQLVQAAPMPVTDPGDPVPQTRWPAASSVQPVRHPDLARYRGIGEGPAVLDGITVVLDPGHGGMDPGCGWPVLTYPQEAIEKEIVMEVAQATRAALEELGARVLMTREDDTFRSIFARPAQIGYWLLEQTAPAASEQGYDLRPLEDIRKLLTPIMAANENRAAGEMGGTGTPLPLKYNMDLQRQYPDWLLLSLHCNASEQYPEAHGLQVFYTSSATVWKEERMAAPGHPVSELNPTYQYYDDAGRAALAQAVYEQVTAAVPELTRSNGGACADQDFAVLREQNLTSVLVELGFLTNRGDRAVLTDRDRYPEIGTAIARAVLQYYSQS